MNIPFYISSNGTLFCIVFGVMALTGFIMRLQSRNFYTLHVFVRKFSMLDLEFPVSALELATYIKGIFLLPKELSSRSLRALKGQLYLDFLFIPFVYGTIFLLCMAVSHKMNFVGHSIFTVLAWAQVAPLFCDLIENFYLLQKIRPDAAISKPSVHKAYQLLGKIKWGIASISVASVISTLFYFWLTGNFSYGAISVLSVIIVELIIIYILMRITGNKPTVDLDQYQNIGN